MTRFMQRWEPLRGLFDLHGDLDRLFGNPKEVSFADWVPPVDIHEDANSVGISVELPGLTKEDIKVTIHDDQLTLSGERKFEQEEKKENFHRVERSYGSFSRTFRLPPTVDTAHIKADMKDGVMHITVPKLPEAKPKLIEVQVH